MKKTTWFFGHLVIFISFNLLVLTYYSNEKLIDLPFEWFRAKNFNFNFYKKNKKIKNWPSPEKKTKEFIVGFYHRLKNI
jgi:hypothetical protein